MNTALAAGLVSDGGEEELTDELIGQSWPRPPGAAQGQSTRWKAFEGQHAQIVEWVGKELTVVRIGALLARRGVSWRTVAAPVLRGTIVRLLGVGGWGRCASPNTRGSARSREGPALPLLLSSLFSHSLFPPFRCA